MEHVFLAIPGFSPMFYVAPRHRNLLAFESRLNLKPTELSNLALMIDQFKQEFTRKRAFSEAVLQVCFYQIVAFLSDQYSQEPSDAPRGRFLALAPVLRYIEEQYMHPITLEELTPMTLDFGIAIIFPEFLRRSPTALPANIARR